jgi:hypothetical protein
VSPVAFVAGIIVGLLVAGALGVVLARRARAALVGEMVDRLSPVLEKRARDLGVSVSIVPSARIGLSGDIELREVSGLERLMRLAEAIEEKDHHQLGYVDTLRVSKDEVDAHMPATRTAVRPTSR